jgi:hypothetical protein
MSHPEKTVEIAHKLYQLRRAAHMFYGNSYAENTGLMKQVIERVQQRERLDVLQAAMYVAARVNPSDVREVALIFAAALDIVEPPNATG